MEKTVSSENVPDEFGTLLRQVSDNGDHYVVEQDGVPLAAVIPFQLYAQWKRQRTEFFDQTRATADRVGLSDDEAIQLVEEAKRAIRAHR